MNTLKSIGTKVITAIVATGLAASLAFGSAGSTVKVTLPEAVNVGGFRPVSTKLQSSRFQAVVCCSCFDPTTAKPPQ
jgi:hypothetical protein